MRRILAGGVVCFVLASAGCGGTADSDDGSAKPASKYVAPAANAPTAPSESKLEKLGLDCASGPPSGDPAQEITWCLGSTRTSKSLLTVDAVAGKLLSWRLSVEPTADAAHDNTAAVDALLQGLGPLVAPHDLSKIEAVDEELEFAPVNGHPVEGEDGDYTVTGVRPGDASRGWSRYAISAANHSKRLSAGTPETDAFAKGAFQVDAKKLVAAGKRSTLDCDSQVGSHPVFESWAFGCYGPHGYSFQVITRDDLQVMIVNVDVTDMTVARARAVTQQIRSIAAASGSAELASFVDTVTRPRAAGSPAYRWVEGLPTSIKPDGSGAVGSRSRDELLGIAR